MDIRTLRSVTNFSMPMASLAACALWGAVLCSPRALLAQEAPDKESRQGEQSAGIYFHAQANSKDVGLPIYPGARPHKEKGNESPAAKFGVWGGSVGLKLAVLKLESDDSAQKVAAFYKKALAKYGTVLDCGATSPQTTNKDRPKSSKQLSCEEDKPEPGTMTFKAGTREKQHVVGIQPNGQGSLFALVYLESPDSDKN